MRLNGKKQIKYGEKMYKIVKKRALCENVISVEIEAPLVAAHAEAGQFVIIRPLEDSERVPLTVSDFDREKKTITVVFQPVGETTAELASLSEGDFVHDVCGPLGKAAEVSGVKHAVVIGGGVGSAIALPVAKAFKKSGARVTAIIGFKTKSAVILREEFLAACDRLILVTDDGSLGEKGFVTEPLSRLLAEGTVDEVMAIGPVIMMKNVCAITKPFGVKTVVSMNPIMIDGTGMCGGCRVNVGKEVKFACVDGPDFDGHMVDFDSLMARNAQYKAFEQKHRENCNLFKKA